MKRHKLKLLALLAMLAVTPASGHGIAARHASDCPDRGTASQRAKLPAPAAPLSVVPLIAAGSLATP